MYGDCQYSINLEGDEEFHPGVFSCYKPVSDDIVVKKNGKKFSSDDWASLYNLTRTNKQKAFSICAEHYLNT
jgi:hypothetical protein